MLRLLIVLLLPGLSQAQTKHPYENKFSPKERLAILALIATAVDTIRATNMDMESMEYLRVNNRNSPAYEMGYLMKTLQENYRQQLEKYIMVKHMGSRLYLTELTLILAEIERHYWEAEHICNMIHELEKKWGIKEEGLKDYDAFLSLELREQKRYVFTPPHTARKNVTKRLKSAHSQHHHNILASKIGTTNRTGSMEVTEPIDSTWPIDYVASKVGTRNRTGSAWPIEYGWEIDYYW